jgi:hypothetical protein
MGRSRLRVCNYSAKKMITNLSDLKLVMKEVDETLSDADITGKYRVTVSNGNKMERKNNSKKK